MREEIKETSTRLKSRQVVFQNWFQEMEERKPEVVVYSTEHFSQPKKWDTEWLIYRKSGTSFSPDTL